MNRLLAGRTGGGRRAHWWWSPGALAVVADWLG
jgi:hypothetical protein